MGAPGSEESNRLWVQNGILIVALIYSMSKLHRAVMLMREA